MTNKQLAEEILQKVGGKKNINSYSHCSTRLRFDLKDKNSIDKAALERTDGILQVMEVAGQTQVVIGSNVQYVYDELATLLYRIPETDFTGCQRKFRSWNRIFPDNQGRR